MKVDVPLLLAFAMVLVGCDPADPIRMLPDSMFAADASTVPTNVPVDAGNNPSVPGGGDAGRGNNAPDGGADAGSNPPTDAGVVSTGFVCTQFLGPNVTVEWFEAGFEKHVDSAKWQVKAPHLSFVEYWADPNHVVWREKNCEGNHAPCETRSKCDGTGGPDRVIFVTQISNYTSTSEADWKTKITAAIATIYSKYPNLKHVELMTFVRGPNNSSCGNETVVSGNLDKAHAALAAASNGKISVAPKFEVPNCTLFGSAPHLTTAGNAMMAEIIGKHYAQE